MRSVALVIFLASVAEALFCLLLLSVSGLVRNRAESVYARDAQQAMPLLLRAADNTDGAAAGEPAALDHLSWRAVEPAVVRMQRRVRGPGHAALTDVLVRRGTVDHALSGLHRRFPSRRARAAAVLALAGPSLGPRGDAARHDLSRLALHDRYTTVRETAVRALGRIGDGGSARALLTCLVLPYPLPAGLVDDTLLRPGTAQPRRGKVRRRAPGSRPSAGPPCRSAPR